MRKEILMRVRPLKEKNEKEKMRKSVKTRGRKKSIGVCIGKICYVCIYRILQPPKRITLAIFFNQIYINIKEFFFLFLSLVETRTVKLPVGELFICTVELSGNIINV